MKKLFSIVFAVLILLSGTHLSIATHICGGKVAAVKWSFSSRKASCGMETGQGNCPDQKTIASNCCQNEIVTYSVDSNYSPSSFQVKEITQNLLQQFLVPVNSLYHLHSIPNSLYTEVSPPGKLLTSAVSLDDICVFRI